MIIPKTKDVSTENMTLETAQTANFTDFPLISCGNGPRCTKTMQTQTLFSLLQKFSRGHTWLESNLAPSYRDLTDPTSRQNFYDTHPDTVS